MLYNAEVNFWKQNAQTIDTQEAITICCSVVDVMLLLGNRIEEMFADKMGDKRFSNIIVNSWKTGIQWYCGISAFIKTENVSSVINKFTDKIQKYEPDYKKVEAKSGGVKGYYVATAVYGSYDCPEVWTLRRFRDYTLAETWYGRAFIHTYYAISPTLVKWFGNTNWFKNMWRGTLDKMVNTLNNKGVEDTPYPQNHFQDRYRMEHNLQVPQVQVPFLRLRTFYSFFSGKR